MSRFISEISLKKYTISHFLAILIGLFLYKTSLSQIEFCLSIDSMKIINHICATVFVPKCVHSPNMI